MRRDAGPGGADREAGVRALVARRSPGGSVRRELVRLAPGELGEDGVLVRVSYSSLNYKDALASSAGGKVARRDLLVPGIDLAGVVEESEDPGFVPGARVLAHGYGLGAERHGGYAELARVPSEWLVPVPEGLSLRDTMAIGTAGFTAAMSVAALEAAGVCPELGPVLVTGATGGVGCAAICILATRGYEVAASSGKPGALGIVAPLGARCVLTREETSAPASRPLDHERWGAAVDCVGGATLAYVLRSLRHAGAVAASGLTGGVALETTVLPFILRGVSLLGVDSASLGIERRRALWQRVAADLRPVGLERVTREVDLEGVDDALEAILAGRSTGRTVVRLGPGPSVQ